MTINADLHCHTTASDGTLGPLELFQRAQQQGVDVLAITDHDSVEAHYFLQQHFLQHPLSDGPKLITGVELSTTWSGVEIHIVGLNFPLNHPDLARIIGHQTEARKQRSLHIAKKLVKQLQLTITADELFTEVTHIALSRQHSTSDGFALTESTVQTGRPHFAQWLINHNYVRDANDAFNRYLSDKKLGNLRAFWPPMSRAIAWLRALDGKAVLAHPGKYKMTRTKLRALITDFKLAGGHALEVVGGVNVPGQKEVFAELCREFELQGSRGSDFHSPDYKWVELGRLTPLPESTAPVWTNW